ncbi:peptidase [Planosporangium thailandense]|uniref:Zinc metalloprotease n=1 Tax=Planosporangium thailandense TaxID=765197 RepID=A0ABX0Y658_9ACTN|nr:site-2 protease family protein [Planosporangium thailandense]NJC73828.1 peptidase [Planosporangium thailandense]
MTQTLRLGRVAGIPVGVHWSVLVVMVLLVQGLATVVLPSSAPGQALWTYWVVAAGASVLFLLSLLAHELAHALVGRYFGIRVQRVTLWLLGGVAELADEAPHARADLLVAGAGPLASIVAGALSGVGALVASVAGAPPVLTAALVWLTLINGVLALFNLLPGAPLDGGRVLRAILWQVRGDRDRASQAAARTGRGIGLVLVALGLAQVLVSGQLRGLWLAFVGWFLVTAATAEEAAARYRSLLGDVPVRQIMNPYPVSGNPDQSVGDFTRTVVSRAHHRAFPLRDWQGRPAGVVRLVDVTRVPADARDSTPLSELATRPELAAVVPASRPAAEIAPAVARGGLVLVVQDGLLVGVVSEADMVRAAELARQS